MCDYSIGIAKKNYKKGEEEMALNLVSKGKLDIDSAAEELNITTDEIQVMLNELLSSKKAS